MVLPNIWSQGQLFAFSALDGKSLASDDFVGILCGDKIGIRFFTKIMRELIIVNPQKLPYELKAVTGDYIKLEFGNGNIAQIIYTERHLIIGSTGKNCLAVATAEDKCASYIKEDILIQNTNDGEYTALYNLDDKFAFAYGKTETEAIEKVKKGIILNITEEENKKTALYKAHSLSEDNEYARLYSKCLSTMKTQAYSPEGNFKRIWTTPDRLPHRHLWLWDSIFHALGFRNISLDLAENIILALFDVQSENGFIPHCATVNNRSDITQPPVIAWGSFEVYQKSKNKDFLKTIFEHNKQFLLWCRENRRLTEKELYTWNTQSDKNCRCDESGMDNSPRFDIEERLFAIDFSCFMANETRYMQKIAEELGDTNSALYFKEWNNALIKDINDVLWCKEDKFYYDYIIEKKSTIKSLQ